MSTLGEQQIKRGRLLFLMVAGAIGIVFLVLGVYQLVEFSDSTAFCGKLCHNVMYPEYTVYNASPHSSVTCAQCHVGSGADYLVKSKLSGIPLVFATITGNYDRPIPTPVENLRPATETCQACHRPDMFFGDTVRVHTTYLQDAANTPKVDTRVLRIGGGEAEVASDIHWHVAAEVWYLPLDKERQQIAWVGVVDSDNNLTEYVDPKDQGVVTNDRVQKDARLMDCIDCHNRATHIFQSPEELIDTAILRGRIDKNLPYIKREAMNVLGTVNGSLDEANAKIQKLFEFYSTNYPDLYKNSKPTISSTLGVLKEIAALTTFPDMNVSWKTYTNNVSHIESPGCFRCHGKLVATSGATEGKVVDSDCTLCHYFQSTQ